MQIVSISKPVLTPMEVVLRGLLSNTTPKLEVVELPGKGRGVVAGEALASGVFICEYKTHAIYPRTQKQQHEEEYICNGEGCYIVEAQTSRGWMCFDATRRFNSWGRLLNHASHPNCKLFKPLMVRGKWRLGIVTIRDVEKGEELTYNYGCQPGGIDWLYKRPPKVVSITFILCKWHGCLGYTHGSHSARFNRLCRKFTGI